MKRVLFKPIAFVGLFFMLWGCKKDVEFASIELKWNESGSFIPSGNWQFYTDTLQDRVGNAYGQVSRITSNYIQLISTQYDACAAAHAFLPLSVGDSKINLQDPKRIEITLRKCIRTNSSEAYVVLIRGGRYIRISLGNWSTNQVVSVEISPSAITATNLTINQVLSVEELSSFGTLFNQDGILFFAKGCGAQQNNLATIEVAKIRMYTPSF